MKCLVCNHPMHYFFSKTFNCYGLDKVDYWRCEHCGFCLSKTHAALSTENWEKLNYQYHTDYQGTDYCADDPNWLKRLHNQVDAIADLAQLNLIPNDNDWLDYACGDGKLADFLKEKAHLNLKKYDKYLFGSEHYLTTAQLTAQQYDFVITTSVFEHFLARADYNQLEALVSDTGVMGLHTLVCENIPADPDWFYLLPVHTAFFSNKSMQILFDDWHFKASLYNVESRLWFWFKVIPDNIQTIISDANHRQDKPHYIYQESFVDYWK